MKTYEPAYGYFKKGDDINFLLDADRQNSAQAFKDHAALMRRAAEISERLASLAVEGQVKIITADTHMVSLEIASQELIDVLIKDEIIDVWDDGEDEVQGEFDFGDE